MLGYRIIPDSPASPDNNTADRERTELLDAFAAQCRTEGWFKSPYFCDPNHARLLGYVRQSEHPVTAKTLCERYGLHHKTVWRGLLTLTRRGKLARSRAGHGAEYFYTVVEGNDNGHQ